MNRLLIDLGKFRNFIHPIARKTIEPGLALPERVPKAYRERLQGDVEFGSCTGLRCLPRSVNEAISALNEVKRRFDVRTINEIPCGDFNWMDLFLRDHPEIVYTGFDKVAPLILRNRNQTRYDFFLLDITNSIPPASDLIFCKDFLNHLDDNSVRRAIRNMVKSGSKYLLASNNFGCENLSLPKDANGSRHLDICREPFNYPQPLWMTRHLGLWALTDLK